MTRRRRVLPAGPKRQLLRDARSTTDLIACVVRQVFTPKALNLPAQGRSSASAPWENRPHFQCAVPQRGCIEGVMQPLRGRRAMMGAPYPGFARRRATLGFGMERLRRKDDARILVA